MTVNITRAQAGLTELPAKCETYSGDAMDAFLKAEASINDKIDGLQTRLIEQAGRIDWYKLELRSRDLELVRLETESGFMAQRLKLIQAELKLAKDELDIWRKLDNKKGE